MPKAKTKTEEETLEEERQANLAEVPEGAEFPYHKGGGWYVTEEGDVVQGDPDDEDVATNADGEPVDQTFHGPTQYDDPDFGPNEETEKAAKELAKDKPQNEPAPEIEASEQPVKTPEPDTSRKARQREADLTAQNLSSGVSPSPSDTDVPEYEGPQLQPTPAHGDGHPMTFAAQGDDD